MRIVIALGGNALLRGRTHDHRSPAQEHQDRGGGDRAAVCRHSIVVVHGNGRSSACCRCRPSRTPVPKPYPLDVLDAGTQGIIGYLIQEELRSLLPPEHQVAALLTMITVDPADPGVRTSDQVRRPGV